MFHIPPDPFELFTLNGESVSIAPPSSWSGLAPVQVRLLSYEWRDGQVGDHTLNRTFKINLINLCWYALVQRKSLESIPY